MHWCSDTVKENNCGMRLEHEPVSLQPQGQHSSRSFGPLRLKSAPSRPPEKTKGRWGQRLTAEKMKVCRWLKPVLVGQFEFLEWTEDDRLRRSRFVALRDDKKARDVVREKRESR
jgi:hypothetical protein